MQESADAGPAPAADEPRKRAAAFFEPLVRFHAAHPVYMWLACVAVLAAGLGIGAYLAPEAVVHRVLWVHFWGPTEADAVQRGAATRFGITVDEDYTLTSEVVYGLILAGALTSIYIHLFRKRGIGVDGRFIAALVPYIAFGPLGRSLEDASVFCRDGTVVERAVGATASTVGSCEPGLFSWFMISPTIYLVTAAAVVAHLLLSHATRNSTRAVALRVVGAWLGVQLAGYTFFFYGARAEFTAAVTPIAFGALCALALAVYWLATTRGGRHQSWALVSWGLPMALAPMVLIARWARGDRFEWVPHAKFVSGIGVLEHPEAPEVIPVVLGLSLLVILVLGALAFLLRRDAPAFAGFLVPLNLGLVGGHMLDAFATFASVCSQPGGSVCGGASFLGLDIYGYGEKHQVSEFFLGFADGWGFPVMKLVLVLLIIVLIDRSAREGKEDPTLVGLVKLAVLVLGLAPGIRDLVRVAMGV